MELELLVNSRGLLPASERMRLHFGQEEPRDGGLQSPKL